MLNFTWKGVPGVYYSKSNAGGPAYHVLHPHKGLTNCFFFLLTRPSKAGKESFLRQILLSDLRLDTYEWKQAKIWPTFNLKMWRHFDFKMCGVISFYIRDITKW